MSKDKEIKRTLYITLLEQTETGSYWCYGSFLFHLKSLAHYHYYLSSHESEIS